MRDSHNFLLLRKGEANLLVSSKKGDVGELYEVRGNVGGDAGGVFFPAVVNGSTGSAARGGDDEGLAIVDS